MGNIFQPNKNIFKPEEFSSYKPDATGQYAWRALYAEITKHESSFRDDQCEFTALKEVDSGIRFAKIVRVEFFRGTPTGMYSAE